MNERFKYPKQIFSAVRQKSAFSVEANLYPADDSDTKTPPMEIYSSFAVFGLAVATIENGSVVANIPPRDMPSVFMEYEVQRKQLQMLQAKFRNKEGSQDQKSKAYTVKIPGYCENKAPAEILMGQEGEQKLLQAKSFLEKNLDKYPGNKRLIEAIDEGFALKSKGVLGNVPSKIMYMQPLYHMDFKHKARKDEQGRNLIYFIDISADPEKDSPWRVTIQNCFAKIVPGSTKPDMDSATQMKKIFFSMTQQEMDLCIYMMRRTMENFELMYFKRQFQAAEEIFQRNRKGA